MPTINFPNDSIVVGGHVTRRGPNGEDLVTTTLPNAAVASLAALKALAAASKTDGAVYTTQDTGQQWRWVAASVLASDGDFLVAVPSDNLGRLFRVDTDVDITAAVVFGTLNNAVLYTVPTGWQIQIASSYIHVTTSWTGGTSSAIGASSSNAGLATPGDLLGGAAGDLAATLASTGPYAQGTKGAKIGTPSALLVGGDTIIFNRVASTFTAGAGVDHFAVRVLLAPAS